MRTTSESKVGGTLFVEGDGSATVKANGGVVLAATAAGRGFIVSTGTITFTIQTDDNSGMSSATTRITSSAFAAVGHQFTSVAGSLAGETHIRVGYTIAGFSSCIFAVSAGVL
jgi:hypothetical protein